jgi:N-acetylneuraminic acid mutarotase
MDPDHGDLPENPLSAAIVKALLSKPGFDGSISYVETVGGAPNDDQRFGDIVDVAPGSDVELHAPGLRNAYGMLFTTKGRLYVTDNGPNLTFGAKSLSATTQGPDPYDDDELNLIERGNYYGSPNRNRGRTDDRENVYRAGLAGPQSIPDVFTQMIGWLPPSSDGIDEFRSDVFEGQMRGTLIIQRYLNKLRRTALSTSGRSVVSGFEINPITMGLGCLVGPNGALLSFVVEEDAVKVLLPDDLSDLDLVINDVFPWRAPATGGTPFVLRGRGFGTLANTSVSIGGNLATLTSVTWDRIDGFTPVESSPTTALEDIVVTVGTASDTLPAAFRFLFAPGLEPGRWDALSSLGTPLGEVAAGVINGVMYLVGEGHNSTFAFDAVNRQWLSTKPMRPFPGTHHSAEVLDGKLYLIGGLDNNSEGRVQYYDPVANNWGIGTSMPWSAGSVSTAVIGGKIYVAGGIVGTSTVSNAAVYDPVLDSWTLLAPMPDSGRNHAAAGTDGSKFYVFGGRRAGNWPTNGYDSTMVFDPVAGTWSWSGDGVSGLLPLPEARGGMGKALWFRDEFYVFGGETDSDPDANVNDVYDRVDVYDPVTNTWRLENPMPWPRHGIFPVQFQGWIFLPGGGTVAGNSQSSLFDAFTRQ